jgi:hypothetical protein
LKIFKKITAYSTLGKHLVQGSGGLPSGCIASALSLLAPGHLGCGFENSDSRGIPTMTFVLNRLYDGTVQKFLKFQKILKIQKEQNHGLIAPHPTLCAALRRNG